MQTNAEFSPITHSISDSLNLACIIVNEWATKKGWNEDPLAGLDIPQHVRERIETALRAEQLALFHSEISEGLEYLRAKEQPAMDDKVPTLTGEAAELADVLIRIFHYCGKRGIDLGEAVRMKHEFNITRPFKHGKKF